ncbi:MAG: hypothetical protein H6906_10245 [Hyphomicrobiales bacterium]|nr:hypothetical protein [Hyphomicrobiales bacterium]
MKYPGAILMGAKLRLLPPSIPYHFFLAAVAFHLAMWGLLALAAWDLDGDLAVFRGGPGPALAAVHAATLGVLAMTAMGAAFQILPVATGQAHRALWPCRATFWLFVPGAAVLVAGMALGSVPAMVLGAVPATLGLLLFAAIFADLLRRGEGLRAFALHAWTALASLLALSALGLALVGDFQWGILAGLGIGHGGVALAHLVLALYGFMGMLAVGFAHILVPMFALANLAPGLWVRVAYGALVGGLVLAAAASLAPAGPAATAGLVAAAVLGLAGAGGHVYLMWSALRTGMRKRLGLSFVLVKVAWLLLLASFPLGALAALDRLGPAGPVLFGYVILFGWLLTFLMGILQRIIPFLAAMNASSTGAPPPRLSQLAEQQPLVIHAVCHFAGLAGIGAGIVLGQGHLVWLGASLGGIGALAFGWFALDVYRRMGRGGGKPTTARTEPAT